MARPPLVVTLLLLLGCPPAPASKPGPGDDTAPPGTDSDPPTETGDSNPDDSTPPVDTGPFDQDHDGWVDAEDCGPADPDVYPGAPDWCDGTDQDCDGDPVGAGMCGEVAPLLQTDAVEWWPDGAPPTLSDYYPRAVWRTSAGDMLATYSYCLDGTGALISWGCVTAMKGGEGELGSDGRFTWTNDDQYAVFTLATVGDFNGDGQEDLLAAIGGSSGPWTSAAFLLSGDTSTWGASGDSLVDRSLAWWESDLYGDALGHDIAGGVDLDADGFEDMMLYAPLEVKGDAWGHWVLLRGRSGDMPRGDRPDDEIVFDLSRGEDDDMYGDFTLLPDLDGDGFGEVVVTTPDVPGFAYAVVSGEGLAAMSGAPVADVFPLSGFDEEHHLSFFAGWRSPSDYDGDGAPDAWAKWNPPDGSSAFALLSGAALSHVQPIADTVLASYAPGPATALTGGGSISATHDFDNDGFPDPVGMFNLGTVEGEAPLCVLPTSRLAPGGIVGEEVVGPCYQPEEGANAGAVNAADLDGDGVPGLHVYYADPGQYSPEGSIYSLEGFVIPYGDPSKW